MRWKHETPKIQEERNKPMTTKRYEFTGETKILYGVTLNQIRRLSDGALGGWIKGEDCLPQGRSGWVLPSAMVCGGEMYDGEMRGGVMHGGVMHGGKMYGGEMRGGVMYGGEMSGGVMHGGTMFGGTMYGGEMRGGTMHGGTMYGGVIHKGMMYGGEMSGGAMHGGVMLGGVIHKGMIVTRDPIYIVLPKHHITVADNMAAVGCEVHDFAYWRKHIEEIGEKHRYSKDHIALYKAMLFAAMDEMEARNAEDTRRKEQTDDNEAI
jgi:hypothetical protein